MVLASGGIGPGHAGVEGAVPMSDEVKVQRRLGASNARWALARYVQVAGPTRTFVKISYKGFFFLRLILGF